MSPLDYLKKAHRIVLKFGSQVVINKDGVFAESLLHPLLKKCLDCNPEAEFIIVSSGAVALGRSTLKSKHSLKTNERQACAAVGQALLIEHYQKIFKPYRRVVAQILVTDGDFSNRQHYNNLSRTFETLLDLGAIPIVNENDTVSTTELEISSKSKSFGDNDKLSAIVAGKLGADLLVIFTNVNGIYNDNPQINKDARLIEEVEDLESLNHIRNRGKSLLGRGGMASKVEAARIASMCGVLTIVSSGENPDILSLGTIIQPRFRIPAKKRWIALSSGFEGVLKINDGATDALLNKHASLLNVGITEVAGDFSKNSIVSIHNSADEEIGRGLSPLAADEIRKLLKAPQMKKAQEIIHRDNLAVFQGNQIR